MRVSCVQIEAHNLADAESGLQRALAMIDEAAGEGADLVVLPECSYPAYFLGGKDEYRKAAVRSWVNLEELLGGKAREHRCHLVVGLVRPMEDDEYLSNDAVLFGPGGEVVGSTAKSFLWHFDRYWFRKGIDYPVFDTAIGRIGLMICADGRMPEIARTLALRGAQIIVDPTALVTGGGDRSALSNPQVEYMLPVRALENGVWIVVANKVGLEADTILYCGRSCVINPGGEKVVVGSPDHEEIVSCQVRLSERAGLPVIRRPATYGLIAAPVSGQPIGNSLREAIVPDATVARAAVLQLRHGRSAAEYLHRVEETAGRLAQQDVELIVLPSAMGTDLDGDDSQSAATRRAVAVLSGRLGVGLALGLTEYDGGRKYRACFLWDSGRLVGKYRKVHQSDPGFTAGEDLAVFETRFGRVGVMLDEEGMLPEVSRCLMLMGADAIVWVALPSQWPLRILARSRADENKVYVALAAPIGGGSAIVSPGGSLVAAALPDVEQAISAQLVWVSSRYKAMAPGTHVVWDRVPQAYGALVEEEGADHSRLG